ncbi:MAG: GlxA family transcriptional regulator [Pseudotabrizicola sp.]|uniref:GlxA family transcriptional regulator n=1 Tax=Pseudotabrizicola sp. TaxID=2939647 RepID=UPI002716F08D|nr:GlxA family transcriptional regulator [Pseudotabrizicola sp.]MDO8881518.1 GlxA family transcriptional regulator [Pseudotabrizicola sp.]MDP2080126.1 GlxA family transcriptional regulator [Pseudotabrizicola sp.]MDZ7575572.1 GlxA family transcriptional regulator [Pseudotabrizicola sp.]
MTDDAARYIAKGVAHVDLPAVASPVPVSFVLLPKFTMLAFASAIEPLRIANQLTGQALFRWQTLSADGQAVACSNGVPIMVDGAFGAVQPEGVVLVCSGVEPENQVSAALADWLRGLWRRGRVVGGLCTGAYALARAGILKGRRFTLHWENLTGFNETYPELTAARQVYCIDDRIVTCAGGVAAADLMLEIIHDRFGIILSQEVMNMCLLTQRRTQNDEQMTSLAARLGTRHEKLIEAVAFLEARIEEPFDLDACAAQLDLSRRQIERLFSRYMGVTPVRYMNDLRLQHGRALLAETDMSVTEVAIACGYASSSHFSKSFRVKYGVSPYRFSHFGK